MISFKKAIIDKKEKYPVLHSYLTQKSKLDKLSYLGEINNIENELITKLFCKISRKEAQDITNLIRTENKEKVAKLF